MVMIGSAHQNAEAGGVEQDGRADGPEHVAGAVAEVDDAEDAEDHGQSQRGQRVETAQGQALERVLDEGGHARLPVVGAVSVRAVQSEVAARSGERAACPLRRRVVTDGHILQSGETVGLKASAAGMVLTISS